MHVSFTGNRPQWPAPALMLPTRETASARWHLSVGGDVVHFGQRETQQQVLARYREQYGLDVDQVAVVGGDGKLSRREKRQLVVKALEAHEHALKNRLAGNFSDRHFSTNIRLADGTWALGTNIELTRDNVFCGERSATVNAWNTALGRHSLKDFQNAEVLGDIRNGLKVDMLVMSSSKPLGDPVAGSPCSDCQSWLATDKYYGPDTKIVALKRNDEGFYLQIREVRDLLPLRGQQKVSLTDKELDGNFPVDLSDKAKDAVAISGIAAGELRDLMQAAKDSYRQNKTAEISGKNLGTAVLLDPGDERGRVIERGQRFDWTARWNEPADLTAALVGYQKLREGNPPAYAMIKAVAYYGESPEQMPSVGSLGKLAQKRGGPDTLMLVIEDDVLKVRTISDYMTDIYISPNSFADRAKV